MKKLFLLATVAFLFTGFAYANDGKKCGKDCCKDKKECKDMKSSKDMKDCKDMKACKDMKKDAKGTKAMVKEPPMAAAKS